MKIHENIEKSKWLGFAKSISLYGTGQVSIWSYSFFSVSINISSEKYCKYNMQHIVWYINDIIHNCTLSIDKIWIHDHSWLFMRGNLTISVIPGQDDIFPKHILDYFLHTISRFFKDFYLERMDLTLRASMEIIIILLSNMNIIIYSWIFMIIILYNISE